MADMDEFAQTRGADDLFDDEIIPVSAEEQNVQTEVVVVPESEPTPPQEITPPEKQPSPRGEPSQRGDNSQRGRGRGGQAKQGRSLQDSRWADPKPAENTSRKKKTPVNVAEPKVTPAAPPAETAEKRPEAEKPQSTPDEESKKDSANGPDAQRVPAVRGDRSATGGLRKAKLTEAELSKRMAAAKENAAKKAAAHARAEADQASFMEREQIAAKKRREELASRRVMDKEREQNRQRKLKAQTGREWDSEKREDDYNPRGGGSQYRRGMHGGVSGQVRRDFDGASEEPSHTTPGRGRGRGGRGGRGRGPSRGSQERSSSKDQSDRKDSKTPAVNDEADFPSLPAGKVPAKSEKTADAGAPAPAPAKPPPSMETLESTMAPVTGSWADQFDE
ncbi:hypothetical protein N7513_010505 [Penicillium frequentans]|nr:hypothetical protein N7513_010505 [Penicillium glabrum]